ncbi:nuclear transport factor 2 family protein [Streptosporangium sp. NPDC048865]|uniref:nuclear transport factor 2 family protein n=1 Tax=Streptosporangium sp. NPDC048865 TaxID=3155766 RepID=UPI0034204902
MGDKQPLESTRSAQLAFVAVDHARLSYAYLNSGDVDAYTSLFEKDTVLRRPEVTVYGRDELERYHQRRIGLHRYSVATVIASGSGEHVVVVGSATGPGSGEQVGFVDVFTVSSRGLFTSQQVFHFTPRGAPR